MDYLQYEYALHAKRMYGSAAFDTVCIYDTTTPELILSMIFMTGDIRLFITDDMAQAVKDGNGFLKDAIEYAAGRCSTVCRLKGDKAPETEPVFGENVKLQVITDQEALKAAVLG